MTQNDGGAANANPDPKSYDIPIRFDGGCLICSANKGEAHMKGCFLETHKVYFTYEYPPIPVRHMDWRAGVEGDEELGRDGFGKDRHDALIDLAQNYEATANPDPKPHDISMTTPDVPYEIIELMAAVLAPTYCTKEKWKTYSVLERARFVDMSTVDVQAALKAAREAGWRLERMK